MALGTASSGGLNHRTIGLVAAVLATIAIAAGVSAIALTRSSSPGRVAENSGSAVPHPDSQAAPLIAPSDTWIHQALARAAAYQPPESAPLRPETPNVVLAPTMLNRMPLTLEEFAARTEGLALVTVEARARGYAQMRDRHPASDEEAGAANLNDDGTVTERIRPGDMVGPHGLIYTAYKVEIAWLDGRHEFNEIVLPGGIAEDIEFTFEGADHPKIGATYLMFLFRRPDGKGLNPELLWFRVDQAGKATEPTVVDHPVARELTGKTPFEARDATSGLVFDNMKALLKEAFPDGNVPAGEPHVELP